ncbi:MAG: hypothetical protein ABFR53_08825 [Actinomycetota bacterium]
MSVGHVARAIEESGIPTVTIVTKAFAHRAHEMKHPRALVVKHLLGRSMGAAHDTERQSDVLNAALALFESASDNATIEEFPHAYRAGA